MKLFIWDGDGISNAFHDDGTLVVLAESADQAREITRNNAQAAMVYQEQQTALWYDNERLSVKLSADQWKAHVEQRLGTYPDDDYWDGSDEALDREPDRIVEIDQPVVVSFNGGGYD